jgi:hypothetical protein
MAQFVASQVGIFNTALRHVAVDRPVASVAETSTNAITCAAFYDTTRDEVLREFNWPFARRYVALTLVGGTITVPVTMDFQYSYRMPADCLLPRRILTGIRQETADGDNRTPFSVGGDATGGLIYTDFQSQAANAFLPAQPQLEYTAAVIDETQFASDFTQALAAKLAYYIAPSLSSGGDSNRLGDRALQLYERMISLAEARALNGQVPDPYPDSVFIRGR